MIIMTLEKDTKQNKSGSWPDNGEELGFSTRAVHAGVSPCPVTGAILTPIYQSTTFVQDSIESYLGKGYSYSRTSNPTVNALQDKIASLEGVKDSVGGATCFSTGMAATVTVLSAFLKTGDHCVMGDCTYGGTNRIARKLFRDHYNIEFTFVDMTDINNVKEAMRPNTKMVWSETPANPTLKLTDLEAISQLLKESNANHNNRCVHVCDATFSTPVITRPLEFGVDVVVQSITKFYDGQNTCVGGAAIVKTKQDDELIKFYQNMHGNIIAPMNAFLILQSTKTMALRVKHQSETALAVAKFLQAHSKVLEVHYPGLDSFPQKTLANKQHRDNIHGSMLWFEVVGGSTNGRKLMNDIQRPWSLCENLGATESIITCPSVMTHANMLKEDRLKVGITDGFVRVSCGIEDVKDLIESLRIALDGL